MKELLEKFNKQLIDLQAREAAKYGQELDLQYADHLSFMEYNGLFDITWYAGNYGYISYSVAELERYPKKIEEDFEFMEQGLSWFMDLLIQHPEKIRSLSFLCEDIGANGTRDWSFDRLIEAGVSFPNLERFKVQGYELGDHNRSIMAAIDMDAAAAVAGLLAKMPNVKEVEIPGVPGAAFFALPFPKLQYLKVQAGYDASNFIGNLAKSPLLSQISLDYMDCLWDEDHQYTAPEEKELLEKLQKDEEYIANAPDPKAARKEVERGRLREAGYSEEEIAFDMDNPDREEAVRLLKAFCTDEQEVKESLEYFESIGRWDENGKALPEEELEWDEPEPSPTLNKRTPFEDYKALFQSKYIGDRFSIKLRECYLTQDELFRLQELNPKVSCLHIPTQMDYYVAHRMKS